MKQYEVVTIGSAIKDIMFYSDQIQKKKLKVRNKFEEFLAVEAGIKIPIEEVFVNFGGGAMNVAVGLKNFGIYTAPMVSIGNDKVGQELHAYLRQKKIDRSLVEVRQSERTGFSVIATAAKDKEHTIFSFKGASADLKISNLRNFRTEWFYVSGLYSPNWQSELAKLMRSLGNGTKVVWNPGEMQLKAPSRMSRFMSFVEVLVLNRYEAEELVKARAKRVTKKQLADKKFLLKKIKEMGANKVVITQGDKGVVAIDENDKYYYLRAESKKTKIVDMVGAGDAFNSGLIAGLVRWEDFERALKLGVKNSANVLYRVGAQNGLLKVKI